MSLPPPTTPPATSTSTRVVAFADLDTLTAYAVWRLRQDVFVVEQDCPYPDLDGRDLEPDTRHVLLLGALDGTDGADAPHRLLGCARVLAEADDVRRVGRVVLAREARGRGLADVLMAAALEECGPAPVLIGAQEPLAGWYGSLGFVLDGEGYVEDGIPHVPMRRG